MEGILICSQPGINYDIKSRTAKNKTLETVKFLADLNISIALLTLIL